MVNELYLALVLPSRCRSRGQPGHARAGHAPSDPRTPRMLSDALDSCAKLAQTVQASLARYEPEPLGTYRCGDTAGAPRSLNTSRSWSTARRRGYRCLRGPLDAGAGHDAAAVRLGSHRVPAAAGTRVGAMLGIKEYADANVVGMYNRLLSAPFPFVLTQSFTFLSQGAAPGVAAAADQPHGQCGRLCALAGRAAARGARCPDQQ